VVVPGPSLMQSPAYYVSLISLCFSPGPKIHRASTGSKHFLFTIATRMAYVMHVMNTAADWPTGIPENPVVVTLGQCTWIKNYFIKIMYLSILYLIVNCDKNLV
jgi:hypothetical protein